MFNGVAIEIRQQRTFNELFWTKGAFICIDCRHIINIRQLLYFVDVRSLDGAFKVLQDLCIVLKLDRISMSF